MGALFRSGAAAALLLAGAGVAGVVAAQAAQAAQPPARAELARPALTGRVVDNANLLDARLETRLTRILATLERRTSDQLVIVTLPSLDGRTIEDVGLELGRRWGIGRRDRDNGVLLIVAPNERRVRIEVGYGLEAILTDPRAAEIIRRDILPHFQEGRFPVGIEAGTQAIVATLIAHEREERRRRR